MSFKAIDKRKLSLPEKEILQELERILDELVRELLKMNNGNAPLKSEDERK